MIYLKPGILNSSLALAVMVLTPTSGLANSGLANPVATYCIVQGGLYGIQDGAEGQSGICQLPDGTKIDAWTYFRENHPDPGSDGSVGLVNPAAAYCLKIGGSYRIEDTEQGQVGICTKPDGTAQDAWALFRAENPA